MLHCLNSLNSPSSAIVSLTTAPYYLCSSLTPSIAARPTISHLQWGEGVLEPQTFRRSIPTLLLSLSWAPHVPSTSSPSSLTCLLWVCICRCAGPPCPLDIASSYSDLPPVGLHPSLRWVLHAPSTASPPPHTCDLCLLWVCTCRCAGPSCPLDIASSYPDLPPVGLHPSLRWALKPPRHRLLLLRPRLLWVCFICRCAGPSCPLDIDFFSSDLPPVACS